MPEDTKNGPDVTAAITIKVNDHDHKFTLEASSSTDLSSLAHAIRARITVDARVWASSMQDGGRGRVTCSFSMSLNGREHTNRASASTSANVAAAAGVLLDEMNDDMRAFVNSTKPAKTADPEA